MKNNLVLMAAISASVLCLVPASHAEPPPKAKKRVEVIALINDPHRSQHASAGATKQHGDKRLVAKAAAQRSEARGSFGPEVGSGAPHQERNPMDHPELFQISKP